jgi:adenylate cyclase
VWTSGSPCGLPVFFQPAPAEAIGADLACPPIVQKMTRKIKQLAVLFADLCGSTRLYCLLGDERARGTVNVAMTVVAEILPRFGGWLVKTLGDEAMCAFEDPNAAVEAACEIHSRIEAALLDGHPIAMHMGLNYGPVIVEGSDMFGDTVNAASHLCAAAAAGQLLIADQTFNALSGPSRDRARPLFFAVLKGNTAESTVYRVLWHADTSMLTDVNLRRHNLIPPDTGTLLLTFGSTAIRIVPHRAVVTLGRDVACDLTIDDRFASRKHATISLRRTQVFLSDQSANGTFVRRPDGSVAHVFRTELLLDGEGEISLGRAFDQEPLHAIGFRRDRRALYRV